MTTKIMHFIFFILFFSSQAFAINLTPIAKEISLKQSGNYNYELPLNIYVTTEQMGKLDRLVTDLNYAQVKYDKCKIKLVVNDLLEVQNSEWLNQWEAFTFAGVNQLTNWEKSFFSEINQGQVNILLVDSLNWTLDGQGTWGLGYGQFLSKEIKAENEIIFFNKAISGSLVIGNYRALSTLTHELGHAAFNLQHTYDAKNIMTSFKSFEPIQFKNFVAEIPTDLSFSEKQCADGIKDNPFLRRVFVDVSSVNDEIGNGIVSINGEVKEKDSCVLRLLLENNQYRIEYDYLGALDIKGLERFDLTKDTTIQNNKMERKLSLKSESPLAQILCNGVAFEGKKIFELIDNKTSEIKIEGLCAGAQSKKLEVRSLRCLVN